jgi:flavin reductase (DIM6/NTAB) family NADH-FMN oxidoreductase RutF
MIANMRTAIDPSDFVCSPVSAWRDDWLLLSVGSREDFNCMTVAWGSFGCMWGKPFAQIVVRPSRHTAGYLARYDEWTLCAFPEDEREALKVLGSLSGRDGDKLARTSLSPEAATCVACPVYAEARLAIECRTLYEQEMDPSAFRDLAIHEMYPGNTNHHRIFYGEILAIGLDPRV